MVVSPDMINQTFVERKHSSWLPPSRVNTLLKSWCPAKALSLLNDALTTHNNITIVVEIELHSLRQVQ